MIQINSVSVYPDVVSVGQTFKIAVRVSDLSWDNLKNTYGTWGTIMNRYTTWQALMEDNPNQTAWNDLVQYENWQEIKATYYDWFNVKDNTK